MMKLEDCKSLLQDSGGRWIWNTVDMREKGSMTYASDLSLTSPSLSWSRLNEYASKSKKHNGFTKISYGRLTRAYLP